MSDKKKDEKTRRQEFYDSMDVFDKALFAFPLAGIIGGGYLGRKFAIKRLKAHPNSQATAASMLVGAGLGNTVGAAPAAVIYGLRHGSEKRGPRK